MLAPEIWQLQLPLTEVWLISGKFSIEIELDIKAHLMNCENVCGFIGCEEMAGVL